MVWSRSKGESKQDTGWGLIFRLNDLFRKIENDVEAGNLAKWDLHMDRIFVNILYKEDAEIVLDAKTNLPIDIKFSDEDIEIFTQTQSNIQTIKNKISTARQNENLEEAKKQTHIYYNYLFKKDIWLRKKLFKLKLYLQQSEHDPRKAIYGG